MALTAGALPSAHSTGAPSLAGNFAPSRARARPYTTTGPCRDPVMGTWRTRPATGRMLPGTKAVLCHR